MKISKVYRCINCDTYFKNAKIYEERHGFDAPPYERVAYCPKCKQANFVEFNLKADKLEFADRLLAAIMFFNAFKSELTDLLGVGCNNENFNNGLDILCEIITEMFEFTSLSMQQKILTMTTRNDFERILIYLKGGL